MANIYLIMTLELVHILLMIVILTNKVKKFLKEKNILDFAFLWVLILTSALVTYNAYLNVSYALGNPDPIIFVGELELGAVIGMMCTAPYFWFLLNLLGWKKVFTLPFVGALYVIVYAILRPTNLLIHFYISTAFIPGAIALIITAFRMKHGLSFSIGISVVMFLFTDTFVSPNLIAFYYSLEYVLMIVLLLGVTGWWDRKVFYDKAYRKEISTSWIGSKVSG